MDYRPRYSAAFGELFVTSTSPLLHSLASQEPQFSATVPRLPSPPDREVKPPEDPRKQWVFFTLLAAAVLIGGVALVAKFGVHGLQERLAALNPVLAIVAMALLPLFGFSIAVVYMAAGAKFGLWMGGLVIAGISIVHLIASHWIARSFLRRPLERILARHRHHLPHFPPSEERSIALMVALVPGPPYFARNYLLALATIPLRVYFWICLPVYVARSYVTLSLGDLSRDPSREKLILLVGVLLIKLTICGFLVQRLRRRLKGTHPTS